MLSEIACSHSLANKDVTWAFSEFTGLVYDFVTLKGQHTNHSCFTIAARLSSEALVCKLLFDMAQEGLVVFASMS